MLQSRMSNITSPIPLTDIESVLAWVDNFKLSRSTKKINRDFSDAVLLAEILNLYYPKLVEMHNYPPRNSHALKLNNWMTLNRKVLKKLKLNLCTETMEQLANAAPGLIERILVMVRDKIHRDEEANKTTKDAEQAMSSGGSYYEACGDDDHVLVVPVKTRVNGVLELIQQKVVTYTAYLSLKEELKDAKDATELLKQKVDHLENLMKLKEERIDELQKQLERKASRRKELETTQTSLVPSINDAFVPTPKASETLINSNVTKVRNTLSYTKVKDIPQQKITCEEETESKELQKEENQKQVTPKATVSELTDYTENSVIVVESVKSEDIMQDAEPKNSDEEFKDSIQDVDINIEDTIQREIKDITNLVVHNANMYM